MPLPPDENEPAQPYLGVVVDGRYSIQRAIGVGGTHMLFEAQHVYTSQRVALKLLRPDYAKEETWREGLLAEARALTRSRHRHVAILFDAGFEMDGNAYLAMDLVGGRRLDGVLATRDRMAVDVARMIGIQLCSALDRMHRAGVCHGAVRPEHILVGEDDERRPWCTLVGFGRAEVAGQPTPLAGARPVGISGYVSPERTSDSQVDVAGDLYAVAATLYECIVGSPPHDAFALDTGPSSSGSAMSPKQLGCTIDDALEKVLLRAVHRDPAMRYPDARSLYFALRDPAGQGQAVAGASADDRRREHERAPYATPIRIVMSDGTTADGRSEDISCGGLLVQVPPGAKLTEQVQVRFARPGSGLIATVPAKVQWSHPGRMSTAVGLAFTSLAPEVAEAINAFVKVMGAHPTRADRPG